MANESSNFDSFVDSRLSQRSRPIVLVEGAMGLLILVIGLSGNLMCAVFVRRKGTTNTFNFYSLSLAVADIILAGVAMPFSVMALFSGDWEFGSFWCTTQGIVAIWSCEASILTMTLAALHRYTKMLKTPFHKRLYTKGFIIKSILFAWVLAVMGPVIYLLRGSSFVFVSAFAICTFDYYNLDIVFATLMAIVLSVLPFNTIVFCYFKVWRFVQAHNNAMNIRNVSTEEIRLTKLVATIVCSFVLCWTPLVIVVFIVAFIGIVSLPRQVCLFAIFMASTSSCLNPIIYSAFIKDARKLCCRLRCSRTAPASSPHSIEQGTLESTKN